MKRFLTAFTAFAAAASLMLGSASASSASTPKPATHHMMTKMSKMSHSCKSGQHWVKGYTRKGKMVKGKMTKSTRVHGYCRK